jgi:LmbE family N-acetylglucosaminyl deacetylase
MDLAGTILGVWAHPDDETYLMAGIMAAAVRNGQRVACITATKGELGIQDPERWPPERLPEIREAELMASLGKLGVDEHYWLGYPDGGCPEVPFESAVEAVASLIRDIQPRHVLTFGPEGMTGHPDHKTVSGWTTAAFERAAPAGAELLYAAVTPEWSDELLDVMLELGAFYEGVEPPVFPKEELAVCFEVPEDLSVLKWEALRAQESQTEGLIAALGEDVTRSINAVEYFRRAASK